MPEVHSHFIDKLAFFNGLISGLALYPQVWTVLTSGSAAGVSLLSFSLILFNSIVWLLYAMHRGLISLAIASFFNTIAGAILVGSVMFFKLMAYWVYILECADKTLYVGCTNDLPKRLKQHNGSKGGAHYTKIRRPVALKYSETHQTLLKARGREAEIKRWPRAKKLDLIYYSHAKNNPELVVR